MIILFKLNKEIFGRSFSSIYCNSRELTNSLGAMSASIYVKIFHHSFKSINKLSIKFVGPSLWSPLSHGALFIYWWGANRINKAKAFIDFGLNNNRIILVYKWKEFPCSPLTIFKAKKKNIYRKMTEKEQATTTLPGTPSQEA